MAKKRNPRKGLSPIKPVGERPLLRLPAALPKDYPDILRTHTEGLLVAAAEYTRKELIWFCKHLLNELDPQVYAAVYNGLRPDIAMEAVRALIRQIIDNNRDSDEDREEAARRVRESYTWGRLVLGIEEAVQQRVREHQKTINHPPASENATEPEPVFAFLDDDSLQISFQGQVYTLTPNQHNIIKVLHAAYVEGRPDVNIRVLLKAVGKKSGGEVRYFFQHRNRELWHRLIVRGQIKGTYRLSLQNPGSN